MSQVIDYSSATLMLAPRKNRPTRRETMYRVVCSECQAERYLPLYAAEKVSREDGCRVCSNRRNSSKGFAVLEQKYGKDFAINFLREHRLKNPSKPEQHVIALLDEQHIAYSREFPLKTDDGIVFYDFAFDNVLVEVDGTYWHSRSEAKARDAYKDALALAHGFIVVRVKEENLKAAQSQIFAALLDERYRAF